MHEQPAGVLADLVSRRRILLGHAERLGRVLGTSGTHPIGDWREQEIIDKPHYQRLKRKLGWLIRRNNTFSLHVHYAVQGRGKAVYLFDRLREYVPHLLALSVNSPFWQGEYTDMHSARVLIFSRAYHRAGLPEPFGSWEDYTDYVDFLTRAGLIDTLGEIWWDVRPHPGLGTVEIRAFDAQTDPVRNEALLSLAAALCDMLALEYDSGELMPIVPNREIEENKWSAQRYGLDGIFVDHETHEAVETRDAMEIARGPPLRDHQQGPLGPGARPWWADGGRSPARGVAGDGIHTRGREGPGGEDLSSVAQLLSEHLAPGLVHDDLPDLGVLAALTATRRAVLLLISLRTIAFFTNRLPSGRPVYLGVVPASHTPTQ